MTAKCSQHRRARPAPIMSQGRILDGLLVATKYGTEPTLAIACLDAERRPLTMLMVEDCPCSAEDVARALDVIIDVAGRPGVAVDAVVLGSSRPGGCDGPTAEDVAMWPDLVERCARAGVTLLDWYVLTPGRAQSVADQFGSRPGT